MSYLWTLNVKSNLSFLDPAFSTMFDGNFEEIHFKTPSVVSGGHLNTNVKMWASFLIVGLTI